MEQPRRFRQPEHDIETLDGLAPGPLAEIVLGAGKNETVRPAIDDPADVDEVRPHDVFRIGKGPFPADADERAAVIRLLVGRGHGSGERRGITVDFAENRRDDARRHRHEMGHEGDRHLFAGGEGELLLDLAEVAVFRSPVGAEAFVDLGEKQADLRLFASPAHARETRYSDAARFYEPFADEGHERHENARRIAARRGDEIRAGDGLSIKFRQSINRAGEELRRRVGVAVKLGVDLRIAQAEVGAEIDEAQSAFEERHCELGGDPVRQGEKRGLGSARDGGFNLRLDERESPHRRRTRETWKDGVQSTARLLSRRDRDQIDVGVHGEQAEQLLPRVSARADDGDLDLCRFHEPVSMAQNPGESKKIGDTSLIFWKTTHLRKRKSRSHFPLRFSDR